jgi:hypothetical protein
MHSSFFLSVSILGNPCPSGARTSARQRRNGRAWRDDDLTASGGLRGRSKKRSETTSGRRQAYAGEVDLDRVLDIFNFNTGHER